MTDIAHTDPGYIQEEETQFRGSTDTQIMTKFGQLVNFLLDQANGINAQYAGLVAATQQVVVGTTGFTTDGAGNFQGVITASTNGKPILFAVAYCIVAGTILTQYPIMTLGPNVSLGLTNGGTANYQSQLVGGNTQLYGIVNNGTVGGLKGGSGPAWSPGTTGAVQWAIVFPAGA